MNKVHESFGGTIFQLKDRSVLFEGPYRVDGDKKLFMVCRALHTAVDLELEYPEPIENYLNRFEHAWDNHTGQNIIFDNEDVEVSYEWCLQETKKEFLESRNNLNNA